MPGLGDLFGRGSIGEQLFVWGLLSQIVQALTAPAIEVLEQTSRSLAPNVALSPAAVATAVNRGFMDAGSAKVEAALSGISESRLTRMIDLAGDAPGPSELVEAWRRGIIAYEGDTDGVPGFLDGIRQGNLRNVWAPMYRALAVQLPSWSDALDALLEGQLDEPTAKQWFTKAGGDPDAFQWLYDTRGNAPTPDMLGELANRGIIPWTGTGPGAVSFEQGFLEGPWRNKWLEPMRRLMEYRPPPRTITAMVREGVLTQAQALTLLKQYGLSDELAAAYVKGATSTKAATSKALTETQIEEMLSAHLISAEQATTMLHGIGVPAADAALIVSYTGLKRSIANTNSAITRIRTLYVARKLTGPAATGALAKLGIAADQADAMIATWDVEARANVKTLSEGQIASAVYYQVMTPAEGIASLAALGYDAYDAWVVLSVRNQGPLDGKPPRTIDPAGTAG